MKKAFNDHLKVEIQPKKLKLMPISRIEYKQNVKELELIMEHKNLQHVSIYTWS